ncbi:ABC transporter ATP-binding protein [Yersinia pestis]|uniref:ABC transporter ATP-binding protein n=1 Tax=Yersinia pestis TaxID=632 RepID=UPI00187B3EF9|nr:ATP-binding cassette domain-containing protein [Yersinia pestis]
MSGIRLSNVFKRFHDTQVINQVDLEIKNGEFCVFIGPSGCGKSTLLRMIAGLETISSGEISIGDKVVNKLAPADRGVAMVFQSYALYPHMTIYDNMAFNLKLAKTEPAEIERRVLNAAKILQLELLLQRLPKALSGGQRQRVAIGRAIVRNPDVLLFDEPLSNLDASLRVATRVEIAKLHHQLGNTMVYVTHDQVEAMTLADKIVLLNSGAAMLNEGSIAQTGHPLELYHHPVNEFVAGFIGSPKMNFLSGELVAGNAQCASIRLGGVREIEVQVSTLKWGSARSICGSATKQRHT